MDCMWNKMKCRELAASEFTKALLFLFLTQKIKSHLEFWKQQECMQDHNFKGIYHRWECSLMGDLPGSSASNPYHAESKVH